MAREVKFKARRCFEGQWEGLLMMAGCVDATLDRGEPELSRHLQFFFLIGNFAAAPALCHAPFC